MNTIDSTNPVQLIELFCPAGYTAIAGGVTSDDALVLLNESSFDPNDATGFIVGVTYLGNGSAQWAGEGTCEA